MSSGNQRYINTAGTHNITMGDDFINVSTSVGAITLVFPNIRDSGAINLNKVWFVNDVDDMAATNNVTIVASDTSPATELNGGTSVVLDTNGFSAEIVPSGYYSYMVSAGTGNGGMSGSGTTNYVVKWTPSGTVLGNSQIFDNGTSIGIGTTTPTAKFYIYTDVNDITGQSGQLITNVNAGTSAAGALFFRNNDNKGFEIGTVSSTHTTYQDTYGTASDSFFTSVINGGNLIFKQRTVGKGIKLFNSANGVVTGQSSVNISDNGTGFYTDSISAIVHIKGTDATSSNYALKVDNSASSPLLYIRNDGLIQLPNTAVGDKILLNTAGDGFGIQSGTFQYFVNNISSSHVFGQGSSSSFTETLRITGGGNVGIGTSNVLGKFQVKVAANANFFVNQIGGVLNIQAVNDTASANVPIELYASSFGIFGGNVGVGTASPTSKLQVLGLSTYADNAAAITAGLTAGAFYIRTGHGLDVVV